jgi:hypothetical protein
MKKAIAMKKLRRFGSIVLWTIVLADINAGLALTSAQRRTLRTRQCTLNYEEPL